VALDATVGGPSSNSYLTVAEADAYFDTRLFSTVWTSATTQQKEAALIQATRTIDAKVTQPWTFENLPDGFTIRRVALLGPDQKAFTVWNGEPASSTQALAWPRTGMVDKLGNELADDVIPQGLKDAVCELALLLLQSDRTVENPAAVAGLKALTAGPVSLEFTDPPPNPQLLPDVVFQFLVPAWWYAFVLEKGVRASIEVI
jgi:hypothetical protein